MYMRRRGDIGCGYFFGFALLLLLFRACNPSQGSTIVPEQPSEVSERPITLVSEPRMPQTQSALPTKAGLQTVTQDVTQYPVAIIDADKLNLRTAPDEKFDRIGTYTRATRVDVLSKTFDEKWLKVRTPDGEVGWMASAYLTYTISLSDIQIVALTGQIESAMTIRGTHVIRKSNGLEFTESEPFALVRGSYLLQSSAPLYGLDGKYVSNCQHKVTLYSVTGNSSFQSDGSRAVSLSNLLGGMYYVQGTGPCDWVVKLTRRN